MAAPAEADGLAVSWARLPTFVAALAGAGSRCLRAARPTRLPVAQARIDDWVEQVDDEVDDDEADRAMTTIASNTGLSRLATACAVRLPSPLRPKTVSVTTAPATSSPNSRPAIVSAGSEALRMTELMSSQPSEAPFARVTWTKGWVRTSATARMSTCARGADSGMASVRVGRMRASIGPGSTTPTQPN